MGRTLKTRLKTGRDIARTLAFLFTGRGYYEPRNLVSYRCAFHAHRVTQYRAGSGPLDGSPVIVLGMHRSGTSLVSQLLRRCGLDLGRHPFDRGRFEGYAENRLIMLINNFLIRKSGGHYLSPDAPHLRYSASDLRQVRALLVGEFRAGANAWGFKDPRACLTVNFWLDLFPAARLVVVRRKPDAILESCIAHFGIDDRDFLQRMIDTYLERIETVAARHPVVSVYFEDLTAKDPRPAVETLVRSVDLDFDRACLDLIDARRPAPSRSIRLDCSDRGRKGEGNGSQTPHAGADHSQAPRGGG